MDRKMRPSLVAGLVAALLLGMLPGAAAANGAPGATRAPRGPAPVLAYYYIWFNVTSWNRAKRDYPVLGRYSSDERSVMARHIRWARQAGIDGFIVSWKSTPTLDRRLQMLIEVATKARFKLAIIYQGLDFHREPLPAARVRADLELFIRRFASAAPFALFEKPLVVWSGTWRFSAADVAAVTTGLRGPLLILASEKNPLGYVRLLGSVDGDAYYWSSADPLRTPGHLKKLRRMSDAVHRHRGLWVAPVAPGFDARMIGGTKVVPRRGGATLRRSLDHATASSPDALGIISWNEFSENSHVEPSRRYGTKALRVLGDVLGTDAPVRSDLDSSGSVPSGPQYGPPLLGGFVVVLLGGAALLSRRRRAIHRRRALAQPAQSRDRWAL